MSEVWYVLRVVNFSILFITFLCMVYKGVGRLVLDRRGFMWDRLMNLLWVVLSMGSVAEILFQDAEGGWRIIAATVVVLVQLYVVLFKFHTDPYNETVRVDDCE